MPEKKAPFSWNSLLFAIGIVLTTIVPMLAYKHYITIPDFLLWFAVGAGIVLMTVIIVLQVIKAKAAGPVV